ncbi:hypothetical protein C8N35_102398 [Breoghania corrubedonensis]|uniref:Membrane protein DedA with SNARE-associated domain n=1 Tax=Breoghania corrubedonensis TaxID=665038 RepID=A0A2T5VD53_9HYPH|nr:hypothetical protein [Breoghania corrubedonensis]PTW61683.1 hypothetical protein C8N35_102398 [Breoghania corrubedonensis]
MKRYQPLLPPIVLLIAVFAVWIAQSVGILEDSNTLLEKLTSLIFSYGAGLILIVAAVENIIILNVYFPGSVVILGIMASTHGQLERAIYVFLLIWVGQLIGLIFSCLSGQIYGFRGKARTAEKARMLVLFLLFWHPHTASATAFALGEKRFPCRFLICTLASLIWSVFWAIVMYFGVGSVVYEIGWDYISGIFAFLWLALELRSLRRSGKKV